jgi:hypothetical protein
VLARQLAQMVGGMAICAASVLYKRRGATCYVRNQNTFYAALMYGSYFVLFFKFLLQRFFFKTLRCGPKPETIKPLHPNTLTP